MKSASSEDLDLLMRGIGKELYARLQSVAKEAAQELLSLCKKHIPPPSVPYAMWALTQMDTLPDLGRQARVYGLMVDLIQRTKALNLRELPIPEDLDIDTLVDALAPQVASWCSRTLPALLVKAYFGVLGRWAPKVQQATDGEVPLRNALSFLDGLFREVLTLRSTWFDDGELIRRVVRFVPSL